MISELMPIEWIGPRRNGFAVSIGGRLAMHLYSDKVKSIRPKMVRPYRYEAYYEAGSKKWRASCQFDLTVMLDSNLKPKELAMIEYRQYIRGSVWVKFGSNDWPPDNNPNGNEYFLIPPYAGLANDIGLPSSPVSGVGLGEHWKEDGKIFGGKSFRFGYRDTATFDEADEKDLWKPTAEHGHAYWLRDTPGISGPWNGTSITVWFQLYFRGYVVQVERSESGPTKPVAVLARTDWNCFWLNETPMTEWLKATRIPDR